ncbi:MULTISPECIES: hybrid sensor histidine kinase/response regulator [unclassified Janthinobacterium]|uniref:hybrid sensor histidine kinase/response regulator n=1 Tax=unclassified Janthinobacterium TaxID=2610881 RepID=UPI000378EF84|nr:MULTISPECIES: ATP-binding protein [unclassified Janthinobacterium]MEC5163042.1 PAS domain S-box-containing protein [Janthinobacterium sp. CG_S6]
MSEALPSGDFLFEHAACALLLADSNGLILRANASACRWLGYEENELAGKLRMLDLLPVGARLFYHTHCLPILQVKGSVGEIQVDLRNRLGERVPMLINIMRSQHEDRVLDQWALFIASDRREYERELLVARKTAEAALEARQEAEVLLQAVNAQLSATDRRKDEFLATLSHELRNPLAPMRSALDVLKMKFHGVADDRILSVFDRQLRHLTRLIDDLMEVSRISQGRMQLQREPVELTALLRSAAQDVATLMQAARHTLTLSLPAHPVVVDGDATRLVQIVLNLLTNAAKYTPDGGLIKLTLERDQEHVVVRVRDNGIGIPNDALASVFDMFSQLEPALERAKGGLGIGLALVRGLVELHGGTICASSAGQGRGSEFTLQLPLSSDAVSRHVAAEKIELQQANLRVMVVDDNKDAAETITMALELFGCKVRAAHTAEAALDMVADFKPQVALLDIGLPDINGYELARRLRTTAEGSSMTLIASTGWGQEKDRQLAFDAGFNHHLTKPVDFERLRLLLVSDFR